MKCHNCGTSGHIANQNKKYCSFCKMNNHGRSECRKFKNGTSNNESANLLREMKSADETGFCFFARCDNNVLATNEVDIIIDSACTNYMLEDRELFATLDEIFLGSVGSANNSESEIKGKERQQK